MLDQTDRQILTLLQANSRLKIKDMAEAVHLTAPAVTARLQKMEEQGVIQRYTVELNRHQTGCMVHVLVLVTLTEGNHQSYKDYVSRFAYHVDRHYRIAGNGCYHLEMYFEKIEDLSHFLDGLERYASYQVSTVVNFIAFDD
ncbi:Lrp/AsnC family transcriptional regulator [Streptococcus entericus]|uniref:Lrp/AsnC family transcriptional regulator n=1 Tax=Streptococcus entericus TaxID=155680 RepID=UPI00035E72D1|nr:Lrp/AsnC family transcriptional regulator [Streptococcus entericus]